MADLSMQSAADFRAVAQERLSTNVWNYLVDGEGTGNEQAFADVRLVPRPLRDLRDGHTRLALLGEALEHPMLLAPVAYQRLFHPDGEAASAMAASAQGGQSVISSLASQPFPTIVEAALQGAYRDRGSAPWFQLYWQGSREATLRLLQRVLQVMRRVRLVQALSQQTTTWSMLTSKKSSATASEAFSLMHTRPGLF